MELQEEMRKPLGRRAAAVIDHILGAGNRLLNRKPAQGEPELRIPAAQADIGVDRADMQLQIGQSHDRIAGPLEETSR